MATIFQVANVIFLDAPVGTGFSYSHTQEGYYSSDTKSPQAIYLFLRKVSKNYEIKWVILVDLIVSVNYFCKL